MDAWEERFSGEHFLDGFSTTDELWHRLSIVRPLVGDLTGLDLTSGPRDEGWWGRYRWDASDDWKACCADLFSALMQKPLPDSVLSAFVTAVSSALQVQPKWWLTGWWLNAGVKRATTAVELQGIVRAVYAFISSRSQSDWWTWISAVVERTPMGIDLKNSFQLAEEIAIRLSGQKIEPYVEGFGSVLVQAILCELGGRKYELEWSPGYEVHYDGGTIGKRQLQHSWRQLLGRGPCLRENTRPRLSLT